ncbi:MAG: nucleotidyltransferase family protein [Planctomycetota bacterium]|jgi:predicted nucleotidyltransferase
MAESELTKDGVIGAIKKSTSELRSFGVKSIGLFGSFVRSQSSPDSDVDILVEFDVGKRTYDNFIDTCFLLEDLFGRRVEVVTTDSLSPYIKPYVLKEVEYVPLSA